MNDYRRVHRLTPLLEFWTLILALFTIFALNITDSGIKGVRELLTSGGMKGIAIGLGIGIAAFLVLCVLIWLVSGIWWRAMGYQVTDEEVALKRGVLSKQLRTARFDRIQAVDVVESVIARIFSLAALRIETAGGTRSVIQISYLPKAEAEALRAEVLGKVRRVKTGELSEQPPAEEEPEPQALSDVVLPEVPISRTLVGAALHLSTIVTVIFLAVISFTPLPLTTSFPILVGLIPNVWGLVDKSWRFNATLATDSATGEQVVNVKYGLADRRAQSIRLDRIHAATMFQPILWRLTGWWTVRVTVAGYGAEGGDKQSGTTAIVPVATRDEALAVLALVTSLNREELEDVAKPEGHTAPTYTSPKRAWWATPFDRAQQAVTLTPHAVITHSGRLSRRVSIVEPAHIQELTYARGPIARACGVATVRMDLVKGPVSMAGEQLSPAHAEELLERLRGRTLPDYYGG